MKPSLSVPLNLGQDFFLLNGNLNFYIKQKSRLFLKLLVRGGGQIVIPNGPDGQIFTFNNAIPPFNINTKSFNYISGTILETKKK